MCVPTILWYTREQPVRRLRTAVAPVYTTNNTAYTFTPRPSGELIFRFTHACNMVEIKRSIARETPRISDDLFALLDGRLAETPGSLSGKKQYCCCGVATHNVTTPKQNKRREMLHSNRVVLNPRLLRAYILFSTRVRSLQYIVTYARRSWFVRWKFKSKYGRKYSVFGRNDDNIDKLEFRLYNLVGRFLTVLIALILNFH